MGTDLSHGCAHFEERTGDDGRCAISVFLQSRRREATFTLGPRTVTRRLVVTPRFTNMDGNERPTCALPDRRHRPMLALSPRASASPKRHRIELGHHGRASRSRAVDLRARSPCCSTCACYATTHVGLWKRLCTHGPSAQRQSSWPHSWLCGECGQRVSSSASGPCVHRTSRSPWPHAPR